MSPQEKAKELYMKFYGIPLYIKTVKECCYIAVNEIMTALDNNMGGWDAKYWEEVKKEIDKL
jgi:hypothetical protein